MRRSLALIASLALFGAVAPAAVATTPFRHCRGLQGIECARVQVPLDRSGHLPGKIVLHVERLRARRATGGALVALAGGPGESAALALPLLAEAIAPALSSRDLIVFDQRGTGRSGLLRCPSLERAPFGDPGAAVRDCAASLGSRRAFYTTLDSAEDIEAVRRAIGVERITLYGTSYGTKVALAYATRYPTHVERLVLDSLVPLDGPDPFMRDLFVAVPRVLRALCAGRACRAITADPVGDLASLVAALGRRPILGDVVGGDGRARDRRLGRLRLLRMLIDGDLDPTLRAEFPAAVKATLTGDAEPILRLAHRATLFESELPSPEQFSSALFVATTCEDGPLPWEPAASFSDRWGRTLARASTFPDATFYPFDRATGRASDILRLCAHWPADGPQHPLPAGPLPNVPTLVLSGEADLRTPAENAAGLAAGVPRTTRLVLPGVGHAALLNDVSLCASRAVERFFKDQPIGPRCPRLGQLVRQSLSVLFSPTAVPPSSLRAVPPAAGVRGRPGRTLHAFELTILDASLQQLYAGFSLLPERAIGGLRAGRVRADGRLDRYSYVPGVAVSDIARGRHRPSSLFGRGRFERFRVAGHAASDGVLVLDKRRLRLRGRIGGKSVHARLFASLRQSMRATGATISYRCCLFAR